MIKAYRYHRFSSAAQEAGTSLERQEAATSTLCEKNGWTITETLQDLGRSAWKGDHLRVGELGKFRDRVDAGEIERGSVLVIENLDRLSRQDVKKARRWVEEVTEAGVLIAVSSPEIVLDEDSLTGVNIGAMVMYCLEAGRSNKESGRKSELLTASWVSARQGAKQGLVITRRCPGWLSVVGTKEKLGRTLINNQRFEVIEERAEVVRQIYRWSAEGLGAEGICKKLNAQRIQSWGINHHKRFDSTWRSGYVRDVLKSSAVEGDYLPRTKFGPTGERIEASTQLIE